ncbi:hypothetical protein BA022_08355 [Diaphorobacter nitroreducens]|nr:hypothetical protein BA022_08355 [Diaphorobacter nitroreducens]
MFPFFMENTMPRACNTASAGASGRKPNTIDLEALLGDNDAQLVYEGLHRLRELKIDALNVVRTEGVRPNGRDFEAWDFGIPQIDRLLARLGAEPVDEDADHPEGA